MWLKIQGTLINLDRVAKIVYHPEPSITFEGRGGSVILRLQNDVEYYRALLDAICDGIDGCESILSFSYANAILETIPDE